MSDRKSLVPCQKAVNLSFHGRPHRRINGESHSVESHTQAPAVASTQEASK